jgi:CheY-like chemotaxis protein
MKRLRLLLCDDDSQMLSFLQSVLETEYTVIGTAEDGQALIAAAQALRPDLVLTDIQMPKMDGIEAVHELRRTLPDCPEVMAAAFSTGAVGYLVKGSSQSLVSAIRTVVRHAANRDDAFANGWNV